MSKKLIIAEKPSVASDIAKALGGFTKHDDYFESESYVLSSAVGHLLELACPEEFEVKRGKWSFAHLPVIPPHFALNPIEKSAARLRVVNKLIKRKDVDGLINACDAGREGELIFNYIVQHAKVGKPVQRLWLQSMTPQAIRDGFARLRPGSEMQGLADAAVCRSESDWLVGINGTRAMTAFNSKTGGFHLTTVGRVQTPTLAIVVERERKIRDFKPRDYWEVEAEFAAKAGNYTGKWFDEGFKGKQEDEHARADRLWEVARAEAIKAATSGKPGIVSEEAKPETRLSPLLFDLTSLQREANGKFGFSAKTTLALAQALYEKHKALTYPRTDSRHLPEDYLPTTRQTLEMLATSQHSHLAPFARQALEHNYLRPTKRVFDNSQVSDHFAIIPTTQAPSGLSEAEQKLYDLVVRRFMAVFFPAAQYQITTRISQVAQHHFKTEGKVLIHPGWLAIYGKEAASETDGGKDGDKGQPLVAVQPGEHPRVALAQAKPLHTKPPARYSEATLLGAMESAGKQVEDEELRSAMQEKGLGTPATRAAIIEGLLSEKYLLREGRELLPTAKAFQLMTLLRGLDVQELCKPELTGEWEYKLAQMERGELPRAQFMQKIAQMTERLVQKAKEYDRDTIPGNYATLTSPCPQCDGIVKENYRRYACTGADGAGEGCGFSFTKSPAGRTFETHEAETLLRERRIGPLEGFRSKAGWPFTSELAIVSDKDTGQFKLEFDFGDDKASEENAEIVDFSGQTSLGACPACGAPVFAHGSNYVCSKAVPTAAQPAPSCNFKSGQIILQQPIAPEQMQKLLATGKTDLLDKFISNRTRRAFKAHLVWDKAGGKVGFEFEQRESKYPPKKGAATASKTTTTKAKTTKTTASKAPAARKPAAANYHPDAALAAVIGSEAVARTEALKKLWDYIKAHNLQDPQDKRTIVADDKLRPVLGKDRAGMFELTGLIGPHLVARSD